MRNPNANRYMPALVLGLGCAFIFGIREQQKVPPRTPMAAIVMPAPAGYKVTDVTVAEEERKVAGMSDYVLRNFEKDSLNVYSVYVGYYDYQVQGKTIHSPRNCLPGAGWEQVESGERTVNTADGAFAVNRFVLANQGTQALVYYWYQGRGRVESSEYRVKWNLLRDAALSGRTEEALVRIVIFLDSRRIRGGSAAEAKAAYAEADALAMARAAELIPGVSRALPVPPDAGGAT